MSKLKSLREQKAALQLELECKHLEQAKKLLESDLFPWTGQRGSWADPEERALNRREGFIPLGSGDFHRTGSKYPAFRNEQELQMIRDTARYISETNPYLIGVLSALCAFVIGKGFSYRVGPHDKTNPPDGLLQDSQDIIDDFIEQSIWNEMEEEIFIRSRIDGESPLRYFGPGTDGILDVRTVEPEQIMKPSSGGDEWNYGVRVDVDDHYHTQGYWISYTGHVADGEEVPADEIEQFKINVRRITRRGLSDLFAVGDVAESALKLLRHMEIGAAIQASIAFIRQHAKATRSQTEDFVSAMPFARKMSENGITTNRVHIVPGTIVDIGENSEYKEPPLASKNTQNFISIVQAALRCVLARWNAPEFLSSDASNANFASTLVAESPFVRRSEIVQNFYKRRFGRVMTKVLETAIEAGLLPPNTLDFIELQVEPPTLVVRNKKEQADVFKIERENGVRSVQTWASEVGLDPEKEAKNIEEWNRLHPDIVPQQANPLAAFANPYKVEQRGNQWVVVKISTGEVIGTHDTKQEAIKHFAALEMNVREGRLGAMPKPFRVVGG